jgi:hypothetical protein
MECSAGIMKGIIHAPCAKPALRPESRDALLIAIAKARGWITDIRLGPSWSGPRVFGVRSGGEPAPSLDMAGVSRRSATGSRSGDGSILTRRDASPDFLASAIIRAMDAFMRGCNYSVGGSPGRCDRLPHWEPVLPAFQVGHI